MSESKKRFCAIYLLPLSLFPCAPRIDAQQTPVAESNSSASPSLTPAVFSLQTLAELKRLQQAALNSDYGYRQGAHLANNIGPRLRGSGQGAKTGDYVAGGMEGIGWGGQCERGKGPALGNV